MVPCKLISSSSPKLKPLLLLSSLVFAASILPSPVSSLPQDLLQPDLVSSLESAIDIVRQVTGVVSKLGGLLGDSRLNNAVTDCIELLDFSADVLGWSAAAAQNHTNEGKGTGDVNFDQRTWLSAVLSNHETCLDGFDGTNGLVKSIIASSLGRVNSLVDQLLAQLVNQTPTPEPSTASPSSSRGAGFPSWVLARDRKVLVRKGVKADVVVAHDSNGNFSKVQDAVNAAPDYSKRRFVIHIKSGVYHEYVEINKTKENIMLVGDGIGATVISGNRNRRDGWTTYRSATLAVNGKGFIARDITIENTAGPNKYQAVALRSDSDLSVFYRCAFHGYQDTLYPHAMRQFYRECRISGTVDFIFGDATAFFQKCHIHPRKGLPGQKNTVTAQGRKNPNQPSGFTFQFCIVSIDPTLLTTIHDHAANTYLGRPWKLYSRTIFMQSNLSDVIHPEGWLKWNNNSTGLDKLFYAEYMNNGPGSRIGSRVKWPGFHLLKTSAQATEYTVAQFIEGNKWLPDTGVAYIAGLI